MNKLPLIFFVILILLYGCSPLLTYKEEPNIKEDIKEEALIYLKEKYNKDFVINKSEKNSSGLHIIYVSPKDDIDQKFSVSVFEFERDKDFRDNYLKKLIAEEIQKRDISKLEELFPLNFHSFYGNIVFKDEILSDFNNVSVSKIISKDAEIVHDYVIYFDRSLSVDTDTVKLAQLIQYLKSVGVKVADIDFVFFNTQPLKTAYESPSYYLSKEGVDFVLSIQPDEYKRLRTKKEIEDFINLLTM